MVLPPDVDVTMEEDCEEDCEDENEDELDDELDDEDIDDELVAVEFVKVILPAEATEDTTCRTGCR